MSRTRKLRSVLVLLALVANVFATAFPAHAAVVGSNASVDITEVLSGQQNTFLFNVSNNGSTAEGPGGLLGAADSAINWVRIGPKTTGGTGTFIPQSAAAEGWTTKTVDLDEDGTDDAAVYEGGTITPTANEDLTLVASAADVPADEVVTWTVEVSDNGGQTIKKATAVGNLSTTIRVLNVEQVFVSGPVGATDNTATSDQSNLTVDTVIKNYGTADLLVDPSLTSSTGTDTITDQGSLTILADGQGTSTFPVDLAASTSPRTFTGDGVVSGVADAMNGQSIALTVQSIANFVYSGNTLQPRAAVSGSTQTFGLTLNKSNPPAITFDLAESVLTFTRSVPSAASFSTNLADPGTTGNGSASIPTSFDSIVVPGDAELQDFDGVYTPSLHLEGVDDNGADFVQNVGITNNFEIDNLVPFVDATITGPAGQADPDNLPVAKDGDVLTFSGTIKKSAAPAAPADTTATITDCWVVITNEVNEEITRYGVDLNICKNNNGNITGSAPLSTEGLDAGRAFLAVIVEDAAGNTTGIETRSTEFVSIDNLTPTVANAITGCAGAGAMLDLEVDQADQACNPNQTVTARFSEPVKGDFIAPDFSVGGNAVVSAVSTCSAETFCDGVVLTLAQEFEDDATPAVRYDHFDLDEEGNIVTDTLPTGPVPVDARDRAEDGPHHQLGNAAVTAIDGIVPELPGLATVTQDGLDADGQPTSNARDLHNGDAYTNQETPVFHVTGLGSLYTAIVALDTNGVPDFQDVADGSTAADTVLGECVVPEGDAEVDCLATVAIPGDATYQLLVASRDPEGNLSLGQTGPNAGLSATPLDLILDNEAPVAESFTATGTAIAVSFDDYLGFGRDFASDWIPRAILANDKRQRFVVSGVGGSGESRTVTVDDTDYAPGDADEVLYTLQGTPDLRYQDLAGNYLGNFTLLASI